MDDLKKAKKLIKKCQETKNFYLDLEKCGITDLNELPELFECTHLETLILRNNLISDISFLKDLKQLQSLDLSSNKIFDYSFLKDLKQLQSLDLSFNQISDISFFKDLKQLQTLNLSNNKMKKVPEWIFQHGMKINIETYGGKGLCLSENPIESPPLEILKQGSLAVLDWFAATKEKLNEIKIILIGEPKAGKTSLLKRLKDDSFDENEEQTDGVNIEDIEFGKCKTFKKQKPLHDITGHFWDFGGQEIMNATHQFFLTKRSIYVLVLDARKDANNANQIRDWVKRVKATGGNSPIIVLANQIDVNPGFGFENKRELKEEFPEIQYFEKISCKKNTNIDLLKNKLAELIPTAELFQTEIDERWITVKNKLQKETEKYLPQKQFINICDMADLTDRLMQKNAITFLHDLGSVLHFEDLNLAEYYVLKPYWITYGAYQILTSKFASDNKGIVAKDKLEFIVNEEKDKKDVYKPVNFEKIQYSPNEILFLADVLHEFKLCFWTTDRNYFIISDLLDTAEPLEITEPIRTSGERIQFAYEYDYLPKSVMPNIMVEMHQILIEMWRTGCVLQKDGSKAVITSYQKRITITVTGEYKKKREFMSVIRFIIDSINQKLSNKPVALIPLPGIKDGFAEYEKLLTRERKGKTDYIYDEDGTNETRFAISKLLDGIPREKKVRSDGVKFQKEVFKRLDGMDGKLDVITNKLDSYFNELVSLSGINKDEIQAAIADLNKRQTVDIINWITTAFEQFDFEMDDKLKGIYTDLKKTDDVQMKLKLSIPFIKLLGIDFGAEVNLNSIAKKLKNKAKEINEKYNIDFELFKLMGVL